MDAVTNVPVPVNEPVLTYAPGSAERAELAAEIGRLGVGGAELAQTIGGELRFGAGPSIPLVVPHNRFHVLGRLPDATHEDARAAVAAAKAAAPGWREMAFDDRAAVF
ncbi:aldehyde dehydrogenase family protein, partial [Marinitenerispora sediminis]